MPRGRLIPPRRATRSSRLGTHGGIKCSFFGAPVVLGCKWRRSCNRPQQAGEGRKLMASGGPMYLIRRVRSVSRVRPCPGQVNKGGVRAWGSPRRAGEARTGNRSPRHRSVLAIIGLRRNSSILPDRAGSRAVYCAHGFELPTTHDPPSRKSVVGEFAYTTHGRRSGVALEPIQG